MESGIPRKEAPGLSAKNMLHHGVDYTTFEGIESPKRAKIHQTVLRGSMVWDADNGGVDGEKGLWGVSKTGKRWCFDWEGC